MIEERKVIMAKNVLAARARDTAGMSQEPTIERELGWSEIAPQHDRAFLLDPVNARKAHDRWTVYELRWNAFLGQDIPPALSFTDLPWPTINDYTITYEEVELFVLSWARPGYQALDWKQRIDKEMDRWSVYESKVLPFVKDGHRTKSRLWVAFARRYLEDMSQKWGDGLAAVATC
ncbi:hypothetical protein MPER_11761 [Moniliophthora perniciosa FA553]|nr:hypothetical protein MPER_11761 [Moniliophthora perniciosa FA553]